MRDSKKKSDSQNDSQNCTQLVYQFEKAFEGEGVVKKRGPDGCKLSLPTRHRSARSHYLTPWILFASPSKFK